MKLISMTDFVLEQFDFLFKGKINQNKFTYRIIRYAKFLKQPLDLSMLKNVSICEDDLIRFEDDFIFCTLESIDKYKIEDLVSWNVGLSEKAIKQIGL